MGCVIEAGVGDVLFARISITGGSDVGLSDVWLTGSVVILSEVFDKFFPKIPTFLTAGVIRL